MNWLGRSSGAFLILILIFFSCEDPGEVGLDLNNPNSLTVGFKELSLESSMINIDSMQTSNQRVLLAGNYDDPIFGKVSTTGFMQMFYDEFFEVPTNAQFDSLTLALKYNYLYGNNISGPKTYKIYKLADSLRFSSIYYNFESVPIEQQIGEGNVILDENDGEDGEIIFKLFDSYGLDLFDIIMDTSSLVFNSKVNFIEYFNGIAITGSENNDIIMGIDPEDLATKMVLHYHFIDADNDTLPRQIDFVGGSLVRFNQILTDKSQTIFANNTSLEEEFNIDDFIYHHGASGLFPKVDLSRVIEFTDSLGPTIIIKAELVIENFEISGDFLKPPELNLFYLTDSTNTFIESMAIGFARSIQIQDQVALVAPLNGDRPLIAQYDPIDNSLKTEITLHIRNMLNGIITQKEFLIFSNIVEPLNESFYPNVATINRFAIKKENIKFRLFYSIPN